jgi:predicted nucleotidyltransferase
MAPRIPIPKQELADICRRYAIAELSLFGSVLRDDFGPTSDIDILIVFAPGQRPPLEQWIALHDEMEALFNRPVDLVERRLIINPFRRHEILTTRQVLHAA